MKRTPAQPEAHWTIDELLAARPNAARVLMRHGMACVGCVMARFETLAEATLEYQLDLARLMEELDASGSSRNNSALHGARRAGESKSGRRKT